MAKQTCGPGAFERSAVTAWACAGMPIDGIALECVSLGPATVLAMQEKR